MPLQELAHEAFELDRTDNGACATNNELTVFPVQAPVAPVTE
jgi:hypothetical protein